MYIDIHTRNGVLFSFKEEATTVICYHMNEKQQNILHTFTDMWNF